MRVLAIDLGKFKSIACDFDTVSRQGQFTKIGTTPQQLHDLIVERAPQRVIEVGNQAGWVKDLCDKLKVQVQVAKPRTTRGVAASDHFHGVVHRSAFTSASSNWKARAGHPHQRPPPRLSR